MALSEVDRSLMSLSPSDASVACSQSFRSLLEADARVPLTAEQLDEAFSLERALRNVGSVFDAIEEVE